MPLSDHFQGAVHHHKRFRIDVEDDVFQLGKFSKRGNGKNHFFRVAGISALGFQKSGAPVDLLKDFFSNFLILIRDDDGGQPLVKARKDRIESFTAREHIYQAVKRNLKTEKIGARHDHHRIYEETAQTGPKSESLISIYCQNINAACRS